MKKLGLFSLVLAATVVAIILLNDPRSPISFSTLLNLEKTAEQAPAENCRSDPKTAVSESELVFRESRATGSLGTAQDPNEPVNLPGAYEYFDEEGISAAAAARFRAISVLPFNPLETHCDRDWVTQGQSFELLYGEKCVSTRKYPPHPYYALSLKELERKAEFDKDALAAAVASERLEAVDKPRSLGLAIYASLLTNKPQPIFWHAKRNLQVENLKDPHQRALRMAQYYMFMRIAKDMGHPQANLDFAANEPPELRKQWDEQARQVHESLLLELTLEGYTPPKSALID
jgi:hypothetical protein